MVDFELPEEDRALIKQILVGYRKDGNENPLLPLNVDLDGDGITDAWGLDDNDDVVLVPGRPLAQTVYVSDGNDIAEEVHDA